MSTLISRKVLVQLRISHHGLHFFLLGSSLPIPSPVPSSENEAHRDCGLASAQRPIPELKTHGFPLLSQSSWKSSALSFPSFVTQEKTLFQPETSAEFYRDWRRHLRSGPERYEALLQLGGPKLGRLFQMDVGFGLLGEMLVALADHVRPADCRAVLGILHSLASTGRFTLNLSLMSRAERELQSLVSEVAGHGHPQLGGAGSGGAAGWASGGGGSAARAADAIPRGLMGPFTFRGPHWSSEAFFDGLGGSAGL